MAQDGSHSVHHMRVDSGTPALPILHPAGSAKRLHTGSVDSAQRDSNAKVDATGESPKLTDDALHNLLLHPLCSLMMIMVISTRRPINTARKTVQTQVVQVVSLVYLVV